MNKLLDDLPLTFTKKQTEEIKVLINEFSANEEEGFKRLNIYDGSVRSGKTWISCVIWCMWVALGKKGDTYLMCAKSLTALKRNVLEVCIDIWGEKYISYSISQKTAKIFGKVVYLEGANDNRAESKIRGMTLKGAYCDELSLFPEDFFKMLLSRLSVTGAKLFGTTNPDTPTHWLYKDFLTKKDIDMRNIKFLIDDNTTLDPKYVENLKKEYTGVYYDRFILGKWVVAEGSIYSIFSNNEKDFIDDNVSIDSYIQIGIDFGGNKSGHAFTATAISYDNKYLHVLKTAWYKARGLTSIDINRLYENFVNDIKERYTEHEIRATYADSAEQVLINGLRLVNTGIPIKNAIKGNINNRIQLTLRLMAMGRLALTSDCADLVKSFETAVYDNKEQRLDNGKINVDSLDSFEYSFESVGKQLSMQ